MASRYSIFWTAKGARNTGAKRWFDNQLLSFHVIFIGRLKLMEGAELTEETKCHPRAWPVNIVRACPQTSMYTHLLVICRIHHELKTLMKHKCWSALNELSLKWNLKQVLWFMSDAVAACNTMFDSTCSLRFDEDILNRNNSEAWRKERELNGDVIYANTLNCKVTMNV